MKKAIIYARQSFTNEAESTSIEVQLESCREWCRKNGVEVVAEYSDANVSSELYPDCQSGREACQIDRGYQVWKSQQLTKGRAEYKVGLGQAFDRIEQGGCDYLVVYTRNRLGRTADGSYLDRYIDNYLIQHKCSLVIVQTGTVLDYSDAFMALFMSFKDSLDYQGLKEKRLASIASVSKRINGYVKWSNAFGVVMQDGQVTFDPVKAQVVKYVYEAVAGGSSYSSILDTLNGKYRQYAKGRQWYMTNIRAMLSNLTYCGYMTNRDGVLDRATNIPEPIVSYTLWQKANEVAQSKKGNAGKTNVKGQPARHFLPLSGYLRCPCGRRLTMYLDRGKVAYHCVNQKDHTCTIYVDDDVLLTIQQTFILSVLESRRRLESSRVMSDRVDSLKVALERLQNELRAKFSIIKTEEDAEFYRDEINRVKQSIVDTKKALIEAQAVTTTEQDRIQALIEQDFHAIMERELLPKEDFMRLLNDTIDHIVVREDALEVVTKHDFVIPIPRKEGKHHAKRLYRCELLCDTEDGTLDGICHYQLHFHDPDKEFSIEGGQCVCGDDDIEIFMH